MMNEAEMKEENEKFPKAKVLMDAELDAWKHIFSRLDILDASILELNESTKIDPSIIQKLIREEIKKKLDEINITNLDIIEAARNEIQSVENKLSDIQFRNQFQESKDRTDESKIEEGIVHFLGSLGQKPSRQVKCSMGIVDIVSDDAIYEVKSRLDKDSIIRGIGQLLLYKEDFQDKRLILIGRKHDQTKKYKSSIEDAGIEIRIWGWGLFTPNQE